jgi:hypothetical protein
MGAIVRSIEISGRPEDVFAHVTDLSHFPEQVASNPAHCGRGSPRRSE